MSSGTPQLSCGRTLLRGFAPELEKVRFEGQVIKAEVKLESDWSAFVGWGCPRGDFHHGRHS